MTTDRAELFDATIDHAADWRARTRLALWREARARRRAERKLVREAYLATLPARLLEEA